jgi:hypothetical protein
MKMQPEFEAIPTFHDPCHADRPEAQPALQVYAADRVATDRRDQYIIRAALLANEYGLPVQNLP